jgi:NAD(P)H-flavin reductase
MTRIRDGKIRRTQADHIYMIGGGTGITPLYQIIQYVTEAEQPSQRPRLTLLFANRTEDDILVKQELEEFEKLN